MIRLRRKAQPAPQRVPVGDDPRLLAIIAKARAEQPRTDEVKAARDYIARSRSGDRRWYPLSEEDKRAIRILQAAKH